MTRLSTFIKLAAGTDLPGENRAKEFVCGDKVICVANVNGVLSALDNVCPHRGGPLGQGEIENGKLVCPWHGWQFDPTTGAVAHNPSARIAVYALRIQGGDVLIEI